MEPITLKVPRMKLKGFEKSEDPNRGYVSLVLENALVMNDIGIDWSVWNGKEDIGHSFTQCRVRTMDSHAYHLHRRHAKCFLYEYIFMGFNEVVREKRIGEVSQFLRGQIPSLDDSEFFQPASWKGTMRIPVQFIRLYGMSGRDGQTRTCLRIGHHFVLWGIPVYPELKLDGIILDQRIIAEVEKILARKRVKILLRYLANHNTFTHEKRDEAVSKVSGCDEERIPPIRFY